MLALYTTLLYNWASVLASHEDLTTSAPPWSASTTSSVADRANNLCLTLVQTHPSTSTFSSILDFYEQLSSMAADSHLQPATRITIPPSPLVYILFFGGSPVIVSRLCGVLARYKNGFQGAMGDSSSQYYPASYVNEFNGFLMDLCNCIWRSRALSRRDTNALGCLVSVPVAESLTVYVEGIDAGSGNLASLFSLSHSATLGLLAADNFRQHEEKEEREGEYQLETRHAGPVTRASIKVLASRGGIEMTWDDYRLGVLRYLEEKGMTGVGELMYSTMTTLMKKA